MSKIVAKLENVRPGVWVLFQDRPMLVVKELVSTVRVYSIQNGFLEYPADTRVYPVRLEFKSITEQGGYIAISNLRPGKWFVTPDCTDFPSLMLDERYVWGKVGLFQSVPEIDEDEESEDDNIYILDSTRVSPVNVYYRVTGITITEARNYITWDAFEVEDKQKFINLLDKKIIVVDNVGNEMLVLQPEPTALECMVVHSHRLDYFDPVEVVVLSRRFSGVFPPEVENMLYVLPESLYNHAWREDFIFPLSPEYETRDGEEVIVCHQFGKYFRR